MPAIASTLITRVFDGRRRHACVVRHASSALYSIHVHRSVISSSSSSCRASLPLMWLVSIRASMLTRFPRLPARLHGYRRPQPDRPCSLSVNQTQHSSTSTVLTCSHARDANLVPAGWTEWRSPSDIVSRSLRLSICADSCQTQ